MPPQNVKNFGLTAAATDLGLGDVLQAQLEAQKIERDKKLAENAKMQRFTASGAAMSLLGPTQ